MINEQLFKEVILDSPNDNEDDFFDYIIKKLYPTFKNDNEYLKCDRNLLIDLNDTIRSYIKDNKYINELYLFILKYRFLFMSKIHYKISSVWDNDRLMQYLFCHDIDGSFHKFIKNLFISYDDYNWNETFITIITTNFQ